VFGALHYSFRPDGALTKEQGLAIAYDTGIVCTDETLLHPDPYPTGKPGAGPGWRRPRDGSPPGSGAPGRVRFALSARSGATRVLRYPQFAQWCGTTRTHDWHVRFNAAAVVYGHLHIPRVTWHDGVRFEEVSIGYPREWKRRTRRPGVPRQILPVDPGE